MIAVKTVAKTVKSVCGEGYVFPCVLILVIVALFSVILTYSTIVTQVNIMRENSKVVLDSYVTTDAREIYNNIKQGNNKTATIDSAAYNTALIGFCTLDESSDKLYYYDSEGTLLFSITKPTLRYMEDKTLEIIAEYTMTIPVRFNRTLITQATVPIKIVSSFNPKF